MIVNLLPSRVINWADEKCTHASPLMRALHVLCRIIFITGQEFQKNDLSLRAAALTFTIMLSLVPMLAMSTALVKGLGGGDQLKKVVYSYVETLETSTPQNEASAAAQSPAESKNVQSDLTQHLRSAIDKVFAYVDRTNFATLGTFGVAGMILSVILVLGNIEMAMNAIWNVESGRSVMRKISDYLALLVLMPVSINVGLAASTVLKSQALLTKFSILLPMAWIQPVLLKFLPVFFLSLTLYVIYLFFPNTRVKTVPAMAGAVFAGFFWFEMQNIYITLQVGVSKYNAIYGSFATLPLFLMWMYFGWIFILIGAQIAFAHQNHNTYRLTTLRADPSLKLAIAYDLTEYIQQQFEAGESATVDHFKSRFPMHHPLLVIDILNQLAGQNLLHTTENGSSLKPSLPRKNLSQRKIIDAVLGKTFSDTAGGKLSRRALDAAALPDPLS